MITTPLSFGEFWQWFFFLRTRLPTVPSHDQAHAQ
jgi:hypothetical protein